MLRILVAAGRHVDVDCLRRELDEPRGDARELFVLYAIGDRSIRTGLLHTSRYWRACHRELDDILGRITTSGVLCDGMATTREPVGAIDETLREFHPDEVVVMRTRTLRGFEPRLRRVLERYARESRRTLTTTWLPS